MDNTPKQPAKLPSAVRAEPSIEDSFTRQLSQLLQNDADFQSIPPDERDRLLKLFRITHTEIVAKYHSGPLPSPDDLAKYNEVVQGGADRIMVMAEKQSAHRIDIESLVIRSQQVQSGRGQIFGLIIGIFGISIGAVVACMGHETVGGIIAGTTVVSLASAFILGKQQQAGDLSRKRKAVQKDANL